MPRDVARCVLETESDAIRRLVDRLDERFDRAVALVLEINGRASRCGKMTAGKTGGIRSS